MRFGVLSTAGDVVVFGDDSGALSAADARTGKVLWSFQTSQIWKSSPMLAKPRELVASYPLTKIASITRHRRLGPTRLSIVIDDGALVVVQALMSRGLGDLATAFTATRSRPST